jgi:hypothetical protein
MQHASHMEVKMRFLKGIFFCYLFSVYGVNAQTPHLIGDNLYNGDGTVPVPSDVDFTAFIRSRPAEILTSDDAGVTGFSYQPGPPPTLTWLVQVGDFPSPWSIVEILKVDFVNSANGESRSIEVNLNDEAVQSFGDVSLPVELASFVAAGGFKRITLKWRTESEAENLGFILRRKPEGETEWAEISSYQNNPTLQGAGNSNSPHDYSFVDQLVAPGVEYSYRLASVDFNGTQHSFGTRTATAASENPVRKNENIPTEFALGQNYPNPFNPATQIEFSIPVKENLGRSRLEIFNLLGQKIRTLVDGPLQAGNYLMAWDGKDENGNRVSSGTYVYYLRNDYFFDIKKMTLLH